MPSAATNHRSRCLNSRQSKTQRIADHRNRAQAHGRRWYSYDVINERQHEIFADIAHSGTTQGSPTRYPGEISLDQRQARALHGDIGAPCKSSASIHAMKRQLIALFVMLAIGLQGSLVAFAGIFPLMSTDCQAAVSSYTDASQDSCCPKGQHSMSCCLEACTGTVAGAVTVTPQVLNWLGSTALLPQFRTTHFSSRGNSPLIRPPIL
jgi:hypothetical protein